MPRKIIAIKAKELSDYIQFKVRADFIPINDKPMTEQDKVQQRIIQSYDKINLEETLFIKFTPTVLLSKMGEIEDEYFDPIQHHNEVIPNLFIGDFASFKKALKRNPHNIDLAIRVNQEKLKFVPFANTRFLELGYDIPDDNSEQSWYKLSEKFVNIFKEIDATLAQNKRVLVSCGMGISRSATTIIAYLMYRYKVTFEQAYSFLYQKRSTVRPRDNFIAGLKAYEKRLFGISNVSGDGTQN